MLEKLLSPDTIAVIGASRTPGKVGHEIVANLVNQGFEGSIIPINPTTDEILGLKCYPSLKESGATIDLSVIAVAQPRVADAIRDSLAAGAQAICVITAGFKETGREGAELEKQIAQQVRDGGARLLGPNCLGLLNTHRRMNASFAKEMPPPGGISVISQSGALCTAILDLAIARNMGLSKLISIGNKADLDERDLVEALADDPQTRVIVAYLESIESGKDFVRTAAETARTKPVVVFKSGTSSAGAKAASSHTGSLAGADIAYGAAFKRSGILRAPTFESLFDYATALAMQPLPRGKRVAIITNAGGPGIMAADAVEHSGLAVAALDQTIAGELAKMLPAAASVHNPIDVLGDADAQRYGAAVAAAQQDPGVDAIVVILTPQAMTQCVDTARAISENRGSKPVLVSFMGGKVVLPGREELLQLGIPEYPSPERAVAALQAMCDYAEWKETPPRMVARFPVNRRRAERVLHRCLRTGQLQVGEAAAKDVMRAYNFNVPAGRIAATADDAAELAVKIGLPVAMKILSPDIVHKSDLGGVKLNLATPDEVRDAFDLMMLRIGKKMPDARLSGVYLEKMCPRGREVILGMTRDPQFGPMLMFGLGGIFVEIMKDVTFHLAPITAQEALEMLRSTKSYALLEGARGRGRVDIDAIANCLQRLSQLVTDFPQITEMDINPLIVGEVGTDPVVADARITLSDARSE
ncbi:MAG: acetate--CoA ligase family protein [Planctomycetota bacterium]|nr:acetate--CoA ligase family protein [Planctomycetota bacterium]